MFIHTYGIYICSVSCMYTRYVQILCTEIQRCFCTFHVASETTASNRCDSPSVEPWHHAPDMAAAFFRVGVASAVSPNKWCLRWGSFRSFVDHLVKETSYFDNDTVPKRLEVYTRYPKLRLFEHGTKTGLPSMIMICDTSFSLDCRHFIESNQQKVQPHVQCVSLSALHVPMTCTIVGAFCKTGVGVPGSGRFDPYHNLFSNETIWLIWLYFFAKYKVKETTNTYLMYLKLANWWWTSHPSCFRFWNARSMLH